MQTIWYGTAVKGLFNLQRGHNPQIENCCSTRKQANITKWQLFKRAWHGLGLLPNASGTRALSVFTEIKDACLKPVSLLPLLLAVAVRTMWWAMTFLDTLYGQYIAWGLLLSGSQKIHTLKINHQFNSIKEKGPLEISQNVQLFHVN